MVYSSEVEHMCVVKKGPNHGPAPIPEEGKWVKAREIKDISGLTHGVGWCAPQQGACKLTLNVKDGVIQEALVETIGCSGMTHSAAMASEILPGKTILEALNVLKQRKSTVVNKIKIHLTISKGDSTLIDWLIDKYNLQEQIVFEGVLPHETLLSYYKSSQGLLFPSIIETLGLPMLEAAAFGLPIIASDLDYAREVLIGYSGVNFVNAFDYRLWANAIEQVCLYPSKYDALPPKKSSWECFFKLIDGN